MDQLEPSVVGEHLFALLSNTCQGSVDVVPESAFPKSFVGLGVVCRGVLVYYRGFGGKSLNKFLVVLRQAVSLKRYQPPAHVDFNLAAVAYQES